MSAAEDRNDRLVRLLPAIQRQSQHWAIRYPQAGIDPADCVQEACLGFLRRAEADPSFLDQDDATISYRVSLDGWNACRRQHRHERHQAPLMEGYDGELLASNERGPEEEAIRADLAERVQGAIANLKLSTRGSRDTYLTIVRGLMEGLSPTQVMVASLGIKKQNWSHYRRRLQHALMALA